MAIQAGKQTFTPLGFMLPIAGAAGSSGVFASSANPFGLAVRITRAVLVISTQSTGASTLDIGVGASATTSNDGLIDGLSGASAATFDNLTNPGTNGKNFQTWAADTFLNVAEATGDVTALVAQLYVECIPIL